MSRNKFMAGDIVECIVHSYRSIHYREQSVVLACNDNCIILSNPLTDRGHSPYKCDNFVLVFRPPANLGRAGRPRFPVHTSAFLVEASTGDLMFLSNADTDCADSFLYGSSTLVKRVATRLFGNNEPPKESKRHGMLFVAIEVNEGFEFDAVNAAIENGSRRILTDALLSSLENRVRNEVTKNGTSWYIPSTKLVYERVTSVNVRRVAG